MFLVKTDYCAGENIVREFASFEEAIAFAKSLRDPSHMGSDRDLGVNVYSSEFGSELFSGGILADVDISMHGCAPSWATVSRVTGL